jgi:hypothetical protein
MSPTEFAQEMAFGLENLSAIFERNNSFANSDAPVELKMSALIYERQGYYNAIEHLMIRTLKYRQQEIPTGAFSHRDTLNVFSSIVIECHLDASLIGVFEKLMAFRHIATKIYGFLIDWAKLQVMIEAVQAEHHRIAELFQHVTECQVS